MKSKIIIFLIGLCLLSVNVEKGLAANVAKITLYDNDIPFEIPVGHGNEHRSLLPAIPISVFMVDNTQLEIDFLEAIAGEVEITISQDGTPVSSSSENISSPETKVIQLSQELSGCFLLEIRGDNGAYAYAWFTL